MILLQIGVNNGRDDVQKLVRENPFEKIIFIEANPYCSELINESYDFLKERDTEVHIEYVFIGEDLEEEIDFHLPHFETNATGQACSCSKDFLIREGFKEEDIKTIKVKSVSLNTIFEKYNLKHVNYIFVDAEGSDYNILKNFDIKKYTFDQLRFEHGHMSSHEWNFLVDKFYNAGYLDINNEMVDENGFYQSDTLVKHD